jgi:hypothetical protein
VARNTGKWRLNWVSKNKSFFKTNSTKQQYEQEK